MQPNDIIRVDLETGVTLFWEIQGIYLGRLHQESVVHLLPIGHKKNTEGRTYIPSQLLDVALQDTQRVRIYKNNLVA